MLTPQIASMSGTGPRHSMPVSPVGGRHHMLGHHHCMVRKLESGWGEGKQRQAFHCSNAWTMFVEFCQLLVYLIFPIWTTPLRILLFLTKRKNNVTLTRAMATLVGSCTCSIQMFYLALCILSSSVFFFSCFFFPSQILPHYFMWDQKL